MSSRPDGETGKRKGLKIRYAKRIFWKFVRVNQCVTFAETPQP